MTVLAERAKAFRGSWPDEIEGHLGYQKALKAELDWAEANPPLDYLTNWGKDCDEDTAKGIWRNAIAFVRSLLEEPKEEK